MPIRHINIANYNLNVFENQRHDYYGFLYHNAQTKVVLTYTKNIVICKLFWRDESSTVVHRGCFFSGYCNAL